MSREGARLPGYWELLWMLFMMPVRLHRRLNACGIGKPGDFGWRLWLAPTGERAIHRAYVQRMLLVVTTATPAGAALLCGLAEGVGAPVQLFLAALGVSVGVIGGVISGLAASMTIGVVGGVAAGVGFGVAFGASPIAIAGSVTYIGVPYGVVIGVAAGMAGGLAAGVASGVAIGVVIGAAVGVSAVMDFGVAAGMTVGMATGVVAIITVARLPLYPIEAALSVLLYIDARLRNSTSLRFTPVLYHDLSYLPHPLLTTHILLTVDKAPALVRKVLDACAVAPGQQRAGERALSALQAGELEDCARERRFQRVIHLQAEEGSTRPSWLPGVDGAPPVLLVFRDIARYLAAAENATIPHHRLKHLDSADRALAALENQLRADATLLGRALVPIVPTWQQVTREMRVAAEAAATGYLPNPFRPGDALNPELGREVFRGREDVVRQIESLLADASQSASIALLGPRRSGKSSLLKMLPALVPDAVCIFFDLQDHPTDSPAGFFRELQKEAREQARRDRRLDIPPLPEGSPFEAGSAWLKMLDDLAADRRILLCIDEFERLETLFPGGSSDLLRLMGLFRATIQHRRKLRLLVSGAAPFDELGALWNDHFINVQEIRLDLLDRATSLELLTRPIAELPETAILEPIAARIYERTGGQPFLLQAYGFALIQRLNDRQRGSREATLDDLAPVEETVLTRWKPYFADTVNAAPPHARDVLIALAHGRLPELDNRARRWLRRRCLLTEEDHLRVPVLGAWIRDELDE